jgi:hypothetical protein
MRRRKTIWLPNDVFAIPLLNGKYSIGHVLDQRIVNTLRIALYNEMINDLESVDLTGLINNANLISLIEITREQLDYGVWKILGNKQTIIPIERYANEEFRANKWINSITHDAALAEDFVNSYYGLLPWDDWYKPDYLDKYLISQDKKPHNILYKRDMNKN